MSESLRALLSGAIDYAGMFPPARLPLDSALRNYAKFRRCEESWMLSHFVIAASRLSETTPLLAELVDAGDRFTFSVLGTADEDVASWLAKLAADLHKISEFLQQNADRASVAAMEIRLPTDTRDTTKIGALLDAVADCQTMADVELPAIYFDVPPPEDASYFRSDLALKLRTGGLEPSDFPTVGQVAAMVVACRDAGARWKATAGLHHPLRHYNESVGARMHGFLNLFTAAVLADVHRLDESDVAEILADESADSFTFDDEGLCWRNYAAAVEQIQHARSRMISFGCCSFDDPRDDLRALDLL